MTQLFETSTYVDPTIGDPTIVDPTIVGATHSRPHLRAIGISAALRHSRLDILDETTIETGRRGIALAREALRVAATAERIGKTGGDADDASEGAGGAGQGRRRAA